MLSSILGQRAEDRLDVVTRVFKLNLQELIDDIRKIMQFGAVIAGI